MTRAARIAMVTLCATGGALATLPLLRMVATPAIGFWVAAVGATFGVCVSIPIVYRMAKGARRSELVKAESSEALVFTATVDSFVLPDLQRLAPGVDFRYYVSLVFLEAGIAIVYGDDAPERVAFSAWEHIGNIGVGQYPDRHFTYTGTREELATQRIRIEFLRPPNTIDLYIGLVSGPDGKGITTLNHLAKALEQIAKRAGRDLHREPAPFDQ
jgi:hypothetical protein